MWSPGAQLKALSPLLCLLLPGCDRAGGADTGGEADLVWVWGDLHAHSNWSYDGCEDPAGLCVARGEEPASDFFASAAEAGLDFAALTDHAETLRLLPEGEGGPELDVWSRSAELVEGAGGEVLPLLGYEWTAYQPLRADGRGKGSHRTVLFNQPTRCEAVRIPGRPLPEEGFGRDRGESLYLPDASREVVTEPAALWRALDAGLTACAEPGLRWISFAHHPAYTTPQQTDWRMSENAPLREQLVEIYSEHGSSECADPAASGCDFALNLDNGHYPDGAVQTALQLGFRLGFVAGTDGHDARPGSLEDGPSAVAHWEDTDEDGVLDSPMVQFAAGGLTGVGLPRGQILSEDTLFNALQARHTVATTGPRPVFQAFARGADGVLRPPGALLPPEALPAELVVELDGPDSRLAAIELVDASGEVLRTKEGPALQHRWAPSGAAAAYLRLRYIGPDGVEDRVWLSPWFTDGPAAARCGCAGLPSTPVLLLPSVLLALIARRRRSPAGPP